MKSDSSDPVASNQIPLWVRTKDGIAFEDVPIRPNGHLPSFIVIGTAKGGTSSLNHYLDQHSQIHMCPQKEPHFFSTDIIFGRGLPWYKGLYYQATNHQTCGEASTSYTYSLCSALTARRICEHIPQCKLIYIIREPVARVESEILQHLKYIRYALGDTSAFHSVDEYLKHNEYIVHTSEYIEQIEQYLEFFKEDQLLIVLLDDLQRNADETMRSIFSFLNVNPDEAIETRQRFNVTKSFVHGLKTERVADRLRWIPGYNTLKQIVPKEMKNRIRDYMADAIHDNDVVQPMSDETRAQLKVHFKPFNKRLSVFLNQDLSHWDT